MNTRDMSEVVQEWQKRAADGARNLSTVTDRYVHENTWTTVAIATVVGLVVGYLLADRND